jgi:hypothetical protein
VAEPNIHERESFITVLGDPMTSMLSSHLLGPLFIEYEVQVQNL